MNIVSGTIPKLIILLLSLFSGCVPSNNQVTEAQKREIEKFSRTIQTVAYAIEVDPPSGIDTLSKLDIAKEISAKCLIDDAQLLFANKKSNYSWGKVPETVKNGGSCKVEVSKNNGFKATVVGNASTNNFTSVNEN